MHNQTKHIFQILTNIENLFKERDDVRVDKGINSITLSHILTWDEKTTDLTSDYLIFSHTIKLLPDKMYRTYDVLTHHKDGKGEVIRKNKVNTKGYYFGEAVNFQDNEYDTYRLVFDTNDIKEPVRKYLAKKGYKECKVFFKKEEKK